MPPIHLNWTGGVEAPNPSSDPKIRFRSAEGFELDFAGERGRLVTLAYSNSFSYPVIRTAVPHVHVRGLLPLTTADAVLALRHPPYVFLTPLCLFVTRYAKTESRALNQRSPYAAHTAICGHRSPSSTVSSEQPVTSDRSSPSSSPCVPISSSPADALRAFLCDRESRSLLTH